MAKKVREVIAIILRDRWCMEAGDVPDCAEPESWLEDADYLIKELDKAGYIIGEQVPKEEIIDAIANAMILSEDDETMGYYGC